MPKQTPRWSYPTIHTLPNGDIIVEGIEPHTFITATAALVDDDASMERVLNCFWPYTLKECGWRKGGAEYVFFVEGEEE